MSNQFSTDRQISRHQNFLITIRPILLVNGLLLITLGLAMLVPALVDLMAENDDWQIFISSGLLTLLVGAGFYGGAHGAVKETSTRQAFIMVVLAWLLIAGFGAIPYYWSGVAPSFTDAFFESMSGITTTGSTVITGLDFVPPGILLWRGIEQWLGGLGIIVMAVAVLPMLGIGGMQLFKIEAFDTAEKIMPRATQISGSLTMVYVFATAACAIAYLLAGMKIDDAVIHAMTTVATGGYSSKDASLGHFDSHMIYLVATLFMIIGSIPFILLVQMVQGKPFSLLRNSQVRVFLAVLAILIIIAWILNPDYENPANSFVHSMVNVTSIVTGTGYSTTNYSAWGSVAQIFFFYIMFIGGCAGSTSCGIKIFRFQILYEILRQHFKRIFRPHAIAIMRYNRQPLKEDVVSAILTFFFLFSVSFVITAIALSAVGLDFITATSAAGTALANVGPGLGEIIGPAGNFKPLNDAAKWILIIAMFVGRLELLTVFVLLLPSFWKA